LGPALLRLREDPRRRHALRRDRRHGLAAHPRRAARDDVEQEQHDGQDHAAQRQGKFGAKTGTDVVYNFFENKLSPAASLVKDLLKGHDFEGKPLTPQGELSNLLTPLPITNVHELATNPNAANVVLATIADALGISVNTYSPKPKAPR
jgi:hypothetical protein